MMMSDERDEDDTGDDEGGGGGDEEEQAGHHREGESEAANFVEGAANHRSHNLALDWKSVLLLLLMIVV